LGFLDPPGLFRIIKFRPAAADVPDMDKPAPIPRHSRRLVYALLALLPAG